MFKFGSKQKIYEIDNVKIGGHPGELPTVLAGNIFYKGMPEVVNHEMGRFDKKSVLKWIAATEELSELTGVPHFLDVMAMYPTAMKNYVRFVSEHNNKPFFLDGANSETRLAGLSVVRELGLQERVAFNALSPQTSKTEMEAIRDAGITAAILLAHNEMDFSPEGRIAVLTGFEGYLGLLETAKEAGIKEVLVDTIVFDVPSIAYAAEAIRLVKDQLGLPAGCSPANATYDWKTVQNEVLKKGFVAYNASAHIICQLSGANFLIYGPIKQAKNVIPACAMTDAIIAYYATRRLGTKPLTRSHPLYKIFKP